jgi:Domain of unknown function (DUF2382)
MESMPLEDAVSGYRKARRQNRDNRDTGRTSSDTRQDRGRNQGQGSGRSPATRRRAVSCEEAGGNRPNEGWDGPRESEHLIEELLEHEHVEIERIAIGKQVDKAPPVREEGDTLIIPILEEIVIVERRLLLKEEVRVRRIRKKQPYQERMVIRKQEAVITRL